MKKKKVTKQKILGDWFFVIIFLFVLLLILASLDKVSYKERLLENEKEKLIDAITTEVAGTDSTAFIVKDRVDQNKFVGFANKDYEETKQELGLNEDFVIVFTSEDETVLPIAGRPCVGSPDTTVEGVRCG